MKYRNRDTGVIVHRDDGKARGLGSAWEPVAAGSQAAPTEDDKTCPDCGFVAKTSAGLGAHRRRHDS